MDADLDLLLTTVCVTAQTDHHGHDMHEDAPPQDDRRRVLIADDDPVARTTFSALVDADPSLMLVGAVENAQQAVELARTEMPDIALLDWIIHRPEQVGEF